MEKILEYLESTRRGHYHNDEDDYYSCFRHPSCCNPEANDDDAQCNCGADSFNRELDKMIEYVELRKNSLTKETLIALQQNIHHVFGFEPEPNMELPLHEYEVDLYQSIVDIELNKDDFELLLPFVEDMCILLKDKYPDIKITP